MSTGYLVLELQDPPVSCDGSCPEDLNHSRTFGFAEGITATILDLGKDSAKQKLVVVVIPTVWAVLCLDGHNGGSSDGWWAPES